MCFILLDQEIKITLCWKIPINFYRLFSLAFCCVVTGISEFDQKKAAEVALATVRLWLESNHSSVDCVIFCTCENADYEIYKDLMSTVYFPVSRIQLTGNYMKKNLKDYVVNVKIYHSGRFIQAPNLQGKVLKALVGR